MHEVGLMQEALRIALTHAEQNDGKRIHAVTIRLGPLAGVDIEALRLAFEIITSDTAASGAILRIEETQVVCWCENCQRPFDPADYVYRCPQCGRLTADVRQGREFDVVAVEFS